MRYKKTGKLCREFQRPLKLRKQDRNVEIRFRCLVDARHIVVAKHGGDSLPKHVCGNHRRTLLNSGEWVDQICA